MPSHIRTWPTGRIRSAKRSEPSNSRQQTSESLCSARIASEILSTRDIRLASTQRSSHGGHTETRWPDDQRAFAIGQPAGHLAEHAGLRDRRRRVGADQARVADDVSPRQRIDDRSLLPRALQVERRGQAGNAGAPSTMVVG